MNMQYNKILTFISRSLWLGVLPNVEYSMSCVALEVLLILDRLVFR